VTGYTVTMSIRYSFRSQPKKHIFQFKGKCTTVEQLKTHIEYNRNIINVDVINPLTETIYDDNTILKRGLYVQIRRGIETSTYKALKVVSKTTNQAMASGLAELEKRALTADHKRKQQNRHSQKRSFKRKYTNHEVLPVHVPMSKGIPKRFCSEIDTESEKADHLREHEKAYSIVVRGDASLTL